MLKLFFAVEPTPNLSRMSSLTRLNAKHRGPTFIIRVSGPPLVKNHEQLQLRRASLPQDLSRLVCQMLALEIPAATSQYQETASHSPQHQEKGDETREVAKGELGSNADWRYCSGQNWREQESGKLGVGSPVFWSWKVCCPLATPRVPERKGRHVPLTEGPLRVAPLWVTVSDAVGLRGRAFKGQKGVIWRQGLTILA